MVKAGAAVVFGGPEAGNLRLARPECTLGACEKGNTRYMSGANGSRCVAHHLLTSPLSFLPQTTRS